MLFAVFQGPPFRSEALLLAWVRLLHVGGFGGNNFSPNPWAWQSKNYVLRL